MRRLLMLSDINSAHTQKWALGLTSKGWEVHIFSLLESRIDWYSEYGIKVKSFGLPLNTAQTSALEKLKYLRSVKMLKKYVKEIEPDIVHANYATSYGMVARRLRFKPTVLSLWGSEVYDFPGRSFIHRAYFKLAVSYPNVVCSTSLDMKREVNKYIQRDVEIVPFGIDLDQFPLRDKVQDDDLLSIGTVKSLEEVYGIDILIRAYAAFRMQYNRPSQLLIYGGGSQLEELKALADSLNILEFVEFKGFVSGDELQQAYESLDIYCALSRRESFGVAVLEAQAKGLPVIVSNVGGLPEVVQNQTTGFIVPKEDSKEAADAMLKLTDKGVMIKFGQEGRKFVEDSYNFAKNLEQMENLYNRLLGNNN